MTDTAPPPDPLPNGPASRPPPTLSDQLGGLGRTYWIANSIEMFERLAYYGLRTVIPIYMVLSRQRGGPEFNHQQKGTIFFWWALITSFLPMFTGGFADRYGYKRVIALACAIDIAAYVTLAHVKSYPLFFLGCLGLSLGSGLFKPGLQGLLAQSIRKDNASVAWGLFYMLVNIGGLLGPMLASHLRAQNWQWVFYSCALVMSSNFILLLLFPEPPRHPHPEHAHHASVLRVLQVSLKHLLEPRLFIFILIFSAFWLMYNQVFDILPNVIDDWVDSAPLLSWLGDVLHVGGWSAAGRAGQQIPQEMLINVNSFLIVLFMVPVAFLTNFVSPLWSMIIGMTVSAVGTLVLGNTQVGGLVVLGIAIFTFGEMAASPKLKEYIAGIAPAHRKGLYMGYSEVPNGIGWAIGDILSGSLYEHGGDRVNLARQYLVQHLHHSRAAVEALGKDDVLPALARAIHGTPEQATRLLWQTYHPQTMWWWFAGLGGVSILGMVAYHYVIRHLDREARRPAVR